ncbi:MAG: GAF domain-containing protein [Candidatus Rokubacteria bacterium]|nr:GAF domain-containing protein [Candidatus Rokubacteria bacterium]
MRPRSLSLRQAAATIFALSALLPLLVSVFLLWRFELIERAEIQVIVFLALVISVLGFVMFRRVVDRISRMARAVGASAEERRALVVDPRASTVPGLGSVAEIGQIASTFGTMLADLRASTERLDDLVFKLAALNEMVELAAKIPAMSDLLGLVLERTMRTVRAGVGSIMLLDRESQKLRIAAARGLPEEVVAATEVAFGQGIAGSVAKQGEPVLIADLDADPRLASGDGRAYGSGSLICMPVRARDRVIGVINLATGAPGAAAGAAPREFSQTDVHFVNALMTHVAYALDNARLLEETRQALNDLKAAQEQLVQGKTLRALGELSAGISHHLNNLLAVILGRIQLLLLKVEDEPLWHALKTIERAGLDSAELVRRVQGFGQGHLGLRVLRVDLNQLAQDVLELTRPLWRDRAQLRGIGIEAALEPGAIPAVRGDPVSLREALMNLVFNAIDALPEGGRITLRTWAAGESVHCAVSDTGVGMTEEVRRQALDPFFTTKGPHATGLGLSVVYGVLQRHDGEIAIESAEGRGTTVTMRLPVAPAGLSTDSEEPSAAAPTPAPSLRILMIDDEPEVRRAVATMLMVQGHSVVEAGGGREGLARLEAGEPIDCVLTDLGMPEMTGWEVAREIRTRWPRLCVGLVTGWGAELGGPEADRSAVDFILAKPVTLAALHQALAAIARPRA